MKATVKKTIKFAAGVCAALSVVAIGAVVASGTAAKVVAEGLKTAQGTLKQTVEDLRAEVSGEPTPEELAPTVEPEPAAGEAAPMEPTEE